MVRGQEVHDSIAGGLIGANKTCDVEESDLSLQSVQFTQLSWRHCHTLKECTAKL